MGKTEDFVSDAAFIIPAGGASKRYGGDNKLLADLDGKPVFTWSIKAASAVTGGKNIIIAVPENEMEEFRNHTEWTLPGLDVTFVKGGRTRTESVFNAISAIKDKSVKIAAIHDAARPLLTPELLRECIEECRKTGGAMAVAEMLDTVKRVTEDGDYVLETVPRKDLCRAETPQVFKLDKLLPAYRRAMLSDEEFTDDSQIIEKFSDVKVKLVRHKEPNMKVTFQSDLTLCESAIRLLRHQ